MTNSESRPAQPIAPPAPYQGGKRFLAAKIVDRIAEVPHTAYVEPFVGMGGIFFRRPTRPDAEVINDRNGEVVNLFRILQRHYSAFVDHLKFQLTSRREFERLSRTDPTTLTDLERAARFLYLQRTAYGGKVVGQSFGVAAERAARFDLSQLTPMLEDVYERLTGVVIENLDWQEVLSRYDGPSTLFYLDPPYWGCEDDYGKAVFSREQFAVMASRLGNLKGSAILSLNDLPEVRACFADLRSEAVDLHYSISQASGGPKAVGELLIYNFDPPALPLFAGA